MLLFGPGGGMAVGSAADGDFEWDLDIDHVSRWKPGRLRPELDMLANIDACGVHEHGAIYGGGNI